MENILPKIRNLSNNTVELKKYIDRTLAQCVADQDPPYISDFITMAGFNAGGVHMMEALAEKDAVDKSRSMPMESRLTWKIKVNYDEWGNPPVPGEKVYRRIQEPLRHSPTKPFTSMEIEILKQTGEYESKYQTYVPYVIDDKGCITCEFEAASRFLRTFGIHGKTGQRLCDHTTEHSGDPKVVPSEDDKKRHLHVWYWRYKEVDKEMYDALPVIKPQKGPKRGSAEYAEKPNA